MSVPYERAHMRPMLTPVTGTADIAGGNDPALLNRRSTTGARTAGTTGGDA